MTPESRPPVGAPGALKQPTFRQWKGAVMTLAMDCEMCGPALRCPKCGNNACNGGHGQVDGEECDLCPTIYTLQAFLTGMRS